MSDIVKQIVEEQNRDAQNLKIVVECTRELATLVKDTKIKIKELEQRSQIIMYVVVWFIGVWGLKILFYGF
jgi:indole-3-glycerol phosphate synthase